MAARRRRAARGHVALVQRRSGIWGIRWGRKNARQFGVPCIESTGTDNRGDAERVLYRRQREVLGGLALENQGIPPQPLGVVTSDFLRAFKNGELEGASPTKNTLESYATHLLGKRGGLLTFAENEFHRSKGKATTAQLDLVLIQRWVESNRHLAPDSLRIKQIVAKRLARYAHREGLLSKEKLEAIERMKSGRSAKGRAKREGVPTAAEIEALIQALRPSYWAPVAELQLRLGLRKGEVLAIESDWIDDHGQRVVVTVTAKFDTKDHSSRILDGVDEDTLRLARRVVELKQKHRLRATGYTLAWRRALKRLEEAGMPWPYRNKSHTLRARYAESGRAGIPLQIVSERLGHESQRTTERYYHGATNEVVASPFMGKPLLTENIGVEASQGAQVIPISRAS